MKIVVDSKSFIEAVQWATRTFDPRDDGAFVGLRINNKGEGELAHANATSYLKSPFSVTEVDLGKKDELSIPLQGQFLQRLASSLDASDSSELNYEEEILTLTNKLGHFTLPTLTARLPKEPELDSIGEVDSVQYFDAIQRLAKLCDVDSVYSTLGTVDLAFDVKEKVITLMATDRFTLAEVSIPFSPSESSEKLLENRANILFPAGPATLSPAKSATATAELVLDNKTGKFGYKFVDGKIAVFSLLDAEPLPYKVLKTNALASVSKEVQVYTKEFQRAIATISSLAWEENCVFFKCDGESWVVADSYGTNKLEVALEESNVEEVQNMKFVRSVIGKVFPPISTSKMNIKWDSETGAFIFEPVLDDGTVADNVFVLAVPNNEEAK